MGENRTESKNYVTIGKRKAGRGQIALVASLLGLLVIGIFFWFSQQPKDFTPDEVKFDSYLSSQMIRGSLTDRKTVELLYRAYQNLVFEETDSDILGKGVDIKISFIDSKSGETKSLRVFSDGVVQESIKTSDKGKRIKDGGQFYQLLQTYWQEMVEKEKRK